MKRFAFVLILLIILLTSEINAQVKTKPIDPKNPTCDECYCIPHNYPQGSCIENPDVEFSPNCVTIPLPNEFFRNYRRFLKRNLPLCYVYDDSEYPLTSTKRLLARLGDTEILPSLSGAYDTTIGGNSETKYYPIFSLNSIYNEANTNSLIDRVFKEWKKNCPSEPNDTSVRAHGRQCCVRVEWSSKPEDFKLNSGDPNEIKTLLAQVKSDEKIMAAYCDHIMFPCTTKIIINATREFLDPKKFSNYDDLFPTKFFFTDSIPSGRDENTDLNYDKIKFFSLEDLLLHEIGHILGFDHTKDSCPGTFKETIMDSTQKPQTRTGLTWQDRCAYKRANCCPIPDTTASQMFMNGSACDLASTIEQIKKLQALSYPNPADQWVFVPTTVEGNYSVEIYDYVGRQYFNGWLESFDNKIGIPVGHLANGTYVIRVTMSKNIQDFSIVISR